MTTPFTGAVLAGGGSRRMGSDKATLPCRGRPLAAFPLDALRDGGASEVLAVGGRAEALAALGFDARPDAYAGEGPLGGLVTALSLASTDVVVVLACDLPFAAAEGVMAVVAPLARDEVDAVVPAAHGRLQPLHAAYRRRCLGPLADAFGAGERAVHRAVRSLRLASPELADPDWARGVNTPDELRAACGPPGR